MKAKNTNFIDYVKIFCRSGKGGAGSTHFHRSKITSKGGPDGGNGGRGGNIVLIGDSNLRTLQDFRYKKNTLLQTGIQDHQIQNLEKMVTILKYAFRLEQ